MMASPSEEIMQFKEREMLCQESTRIIYAHEQTTKKECSAVSAASTSLPCKLAGDVVVASSVTFCVAPFLTVVDKAIVQSAAGSYTLIQSGMTSLRGILRNPSTYFRSPAFLLMWGVYAATYSTANSLKTISEHKWSTSSVEKQKSSSDGRGVDPTKIGIFLGTTAVNSGSSMLKDQAYARMFGTASTKTVVPRLSYAFWLMRDFSVIGSSFILPDLVSGPMAKTFNIDEEAARNLSQLTLPVMTQFIAGPLHFIGLDLYNRDLGKKSMSDALIDRSKSLLRGFGPVVMARIARIAPGYGIGGVFNTKLRDGWRKSLVIQEENRLLETRVGRNADLHRPFRMISLEKMPFKLLQM